MSDNTCPWCNRPLTGDDSEYVFEDRWGNVFDTRDCLRAYTIDMLGLEADREVDENGDCKQ